MILLFSLYETILFHILCPSYCIHYQRVLTFFQIILSVYTSRFPVISTKKIHELTYIHKNGRSFPFSLATAAVKEQIMNVNLLEN